MKTKLLGLIASVAIGGLASIGAANASTCPVSDTCVTYGVFGLFADDEWDPTGRTLPPTPIPLGGTLYIDVTNGTVISSDLIISGGLFAPLNHIYSQSTSPNSTGLLYGLSLSSLPGNLGDTGTIYFIVPYDQSNPLIGHSIIDIDQGEFYTSGSPSFIPFGLTGYIQATPLPAALPLFATGLGALGLLGWRRKRKNAAALHAPLGALMMSFKLKFAGCLLAACALAFSGLAAATATYAATFDVSGTFVTGTLGGTINIDVTGNAVTSADVTVSGTSPAVSGPFTTKENLVEYPSSDHLLYISLSDAPDSDVLVLFLPTSTLTGYPGGPLCSTTYSCPPVYAQTYLQTPNGQKFEFQDLSSGSLTATPLPAALPLFAGGLGVIGLIAGRRKRKAAGPLAA